MTLLPRCLALILVLGLAPASSQEPPPTLIPVGSDGHTYTLAVVNGYADRPLHGLVAEVVDAPSWVRVAEPTVVLGDISNGSQAAAAFGFSVADDVPVGASGTLRVAVRTEGGDVITESTADLQIGAPTEITLGLPRPNPMGSDGHIVVALPEAAHVTLALFDIRGRLVARLHDELMEAGVHRAPVRAEDLASGTYIARLLVTPEGAPTSMRSVSLTVAR